MYIIYQGDDFMASKWKDYMKKAKGLEKTSGKEFKKLVKVMETFEKNIKGHIKKITDIMSDLSIEEIEKNKDMIIKNLGDTKISGGAKELASDCENYIKQGKMGKLRMALRSKDKNDAHAKRMELAENVRKYAMSNKYTNPEAYFNKKLDKIVKVKKTSETIADSMNMDLLD